MRKYLSIFLGLVVAFNAIALNPSHFTITRITAPYFIVDGNSPSTINKAYVGFEVKNNSNSGVTYSGLRLTITSITTSVMGQNYNLIAPANGVVNVGTLAPGQSRVCYYFISYPANVTPQATFNIQLIDNTASWKTVSFSIYNRSSISANAGGAATTNFINQDLVGGLIYDDVTYVVGNVQNGDESDFQAAVSSQFDPTKMLLLGTTVTASSVPGIPIGASDSLYFITGNGSAGSSVTIRWTFRISAINFTNYLLPCAGATSGNTNYKYTLNTNLGQGSPITVSSNANPLTISKSANKSVYLPNEQALFTVTISNPGSYGVSIDKIIDQLPAGFSFDSLSSSCQVSSSYTTTVPTSGTTGSITLEAALTSGGTSSYFIPAGTSLTLCYYATAPNTATSNLSSTAEAYIGTFKIGSATTIVRVSNTLPMTLLSFRGEWLNGRVQLTWSTASEQNTKDFEVQHSTNTVSWTPLGTIEAAGNSTSIRQYSFVHNTPFKGGVYNFYRIMQRDLDGRFTFSKVASLICDEPGTDVIVYPNPAKGSVTIYIAESRDVKIVNVAGATVWKGILQAGRNQLNLQPHAKGIYWVVAGGVKKQIIIQ